MLGSGFAGLWAALGAARRIDELGVAPGEVNITAVSSQPYHDIRVRNYEADLTACRVPLRDVLDPVAVEHVAAEVTAIDPGSRTVTTTLGTRAYDRLVLASGSRVVQTRTSPGSMSSASTSTPTTARKGCSGTCWRWPAVRTHMLRRPRSW